MPKKRRNRGRRKGAKGHEGWVQCDGCGAKIPRSKAKKITVPVGLVDAQLAKELKSKGAIIHQYRTTKVLCVNCAIFQRVVKVRAKEERRRRIPLQRA